MTKRSSTKLDLQQTASENWHALQLASVRDLLNSCDDGLSFTEANNRLTLHGYNKLPQPQSPPLWLICLRQFRSPLIYVLLVAALLSVSIGEATDAAFIAAVVVLNAIIGATQEWRAEKSAMALRQLLKIKSSVVRDGEVYEIDAEKLVPGDVVWIESGNKIPADVRLLSSHGLELDESLLTGESLPVLKDSEWIGIDRTPLADRQNMLHAGTICIRGRAKAIVISTGLNTAIGQLAVDITTSAGGKPPLMVRLDKFARTIAIVVLCAAVGTGLIGTVFGGHSVTNMFLFAVALSVSAIPEGLPIAVTIALSRASARMAKRGVIVRNLRAVEGLGSCTLIASDKTGTLTCNELTVRKIWLADDKTLEVTGEGYAPSGAILFGSQQITSNSLPELEALIRVATLCNEADLHMRDGQWIWRGDPTDIALLSMGYKLNWKREVALDQYPQFNEIPFEAEHRYAATYHQAGASSIVCVKGAPERVFEMCAWSDAQLMQRAQAHAEQLAAEGYRVLAFAEGSAGPKSEEAHAPPEPTKLKLLGLAAMIDPLRPEVNDAVQACRTAGIRVTMITGDHPVTAFAIARALGLATEQVQVVTGTDLEGKSKQDIHEIVTRATVFARIVPRQKLEIVRAAQDLGHFVAVTGDGVNDAPALKAANIGAAMGRAGTDVARSASDLVISNDNFATIVGGVEEGRIAYDNIRKVTYLLISTGAAEVIAVCLSLITGLPVPLHPVQLLWLNLVTNGLQDVALAFEPAEKGVLNRSPRPPKENIFNQLMIERTVVAALIMGLVCFGTFYWLITHGWNEDSARNIMLLLLVVFQTVHIGNCRSETTSAFVMSPLRSPLLLMCAAGAFAIHVGALYFAPIQHILHTEPVSVQTWGILLGLSISILVGMELHKLSWHLRHRQKVTVGSEVVVQNSDSLGKEG